MDPLISILWPKCDLGNSRLCFKNTVWECKLCQHPASFKHYGSSSFVSVTILRTYLRVFIVKSSELHDTTTTYSLATSNRNTFDVATRRLKNPISHIQWLYSQAFASYLWHLNSYSEQLVSTLAVTCFISAFDIDMMIFLTLIVSIQFSVSHAQAS